MAKKILTNDDKNAIWFIIENKLFNPKNIRGWIITYGKYLKDILEIEGYVEKPQRGKEIKQNSPINFYFGEFLFSLNLEGGKFAYTIIIDNEQYNFHVDLAYSVPVQIPENKNKPQLKNKIENSIKSGEFENVVLELLEKKIVHPALHNHPTKEEFHGIRLSFAIENPYLFLYHFAFQLIERGADYHDKNKQLKYIELSRLANVIVNNFDLKHENKIDVKKLFSEIK